MVKRLSEKYVSAFIELKGGKLLSDYKNSSTKITVQCENGHIWYPRWDYIKAGAWCSYCAGNGKITINDARLLGEKFGGTLLDNSIKNSESLLSWRCEKDHLFQKSYAAIKQGIWCPMCSPKWKCEEICRNFFQQLFDAPFVKCKPFIKSDNCFVEFDGYCKSLGIAFEHNGLQHYKTTNKFNNNLEKLEKTKHNDLIKLKLCKKYGIKLFIIPQLFIITKSLHDEVKKQANIINCYLPDKIDQIKLNLYVSDNKLDVAKKMAKQKGGFCLAKEYIHAHQSVEWQCAKGHKWKATFNHIKYGTWCKTCYLQQFTLDKNLLIDLHINKQLSINKIRKILGVTYLFVKKQMQIHNIPIKKQKVKCNISKKTLLDLRKNKLSTYKISKILGCSQATVNNYIKKFGI